MHAEAETWPRSVATPARSRAVRHGILAIVPCARDAHVPNPPSLAIRAACVVPDLVCQRVLAGRQAAAAGCGRGDAVAVGGKGGFPRRSDLRRCGRHAIQRAGNLRHGVRDDQEIAQARRAGHVLVQRFCRCTGRRTPPFEQRTHAGAAASHACRSRLARGGDQRSDQHGIRWHRVNPSGSAGAGRCTGGADRSFRTARLQPALVRAVGVVLRLAWQQRCRRLVAQPVRHGKNHLAQLARAAELPRQSSQDAGGGCRRELAGAGDLGQSARCQRCARQRRTAVFRCRRAGRAAYRSRRGGIFRQAPYCISRRRRHPCRNRPAFARADRRCHRARLDGYRRGRRIR